jgi:hypothetical protein
MSYVPVWNWSLIGSFVIGNVGVVLGIWNRVDQSRDRSRTRQAALPKVELIELARRQMMVGG